jgi:hypothetical protein
VTATEPRPFRARRLPDERRMPGLRRPLPSRILSRTRRSQARSRSERILPLREHARSPRERLRSGGEHGRLRSARNLPRDAHALLLSGPRRSRSERPRQRREQAFFDHVPTHSCWERRLPSRAHASPHAERGGPNPGDRFPPAKGAKSRFEKCPPFRHLATNPDALRTRSA